LKKQQEVNKEASETNSITIDEKIINTEIMNKGKKMTGKVTIRTAIRKSDKTKYMLLSTGRRNFFINEECFDQIVEAINDMSWESDDIIPVSNETVTKETDDKVLNAIEKLTAHISQLGKNQSAITKRLKKLEK